jgi:hypothetical protein
MDNPGFLDYRVPVASDLPMIEPILVDVPNSAHPYGAKGVGEVNIVPPMAAIANAIHRRLTELPIAAAHGARPSTRARRITQTQSCRNRYRQPRNCHSRIVFWRHRAPLSGCEIIEWSWRYLILT